MSTGELPPEVLRALVETLMEEFGDEIPAAYIVIRRDEGAEARARLLELFADGLSSGDRFADVLGQPLETPEAILQALKEDGRVAVTQTLELRPELQALL